MVTNGSLLTRERVRALKSAGLDNLLVSLDSMNPVLHDRQRQISGLHARVVDLLAWLGDDFLQGHRTGGVMCVLSSMNSDQVADVLRFADMQGVYAVVQPYHDKKTGDPEYKAESCDHVLREVLDIKRRHGSVLSSKSYLNGFDSFLRDDMRSTCNAGLKYFSVDPYGYLHPCVDMPSAGHLIEDDVSVVRSPEALENVRACPGCWYSFRGESDTTLSLLGLIEKARLGLSVIIRNGRMRRSRHHCTK